MVSDCVPNASIALASSNPRDLARKKRANRSTKLRQCKLDARREQWLSQVKSKDQCKDEVNSVADTRGGSLRMKNGSGKVTEKLDRKPRIEREPNGGGLSRHNHHYSDYESSPSISPNDRGSVLWTNDSEVNFTTRGRKSSSRRSSSSSNDYLWGCMSEDGGGGARDNGCLDDWETMADALSPPEYKQQEHSLSLDLENHGNSLQYGTQPSMSSQLGTGKASSHARQEIGGTGTKTFPVNYCAWRADDAFRPRSLPNLSKQHLDQERSIWGCNTAASDPISCPICFEDLDCTDSSFLPCSCGFRLCLFCHKRILEDDGRCPGCRKQYDCDPVEGEATFDGGSLTFRLIVA